MGKNDHVWNKTPSLHDTYPLVDPFLEQPIIVVRSLFFQLTIGHVLMNDQLSCRRCNKPLHSTRSPSWEGWCAECESEFIAKRNILKLHWWFLLPFLISLSYFAINIKPLWYGEIHRMGGRQFTGHPFSDVLVVSVVGGILLGGLVAGIRFMLFRLNNS